MKGTLLAVGMGFWAAAATARPPAPLYDPVSLNIGLGCQWQQQCIASQTRAMKRALKYVKNKRPAAWRIQQCNRNASRKRFRVDWIGFDNCIRNAGVNLQPVRVLRSRTRAVTERETQTASRSLGERGH